MLKNQTGDMYIKIYNEFTETNKKRSLTQNELFVYAYLCTEKTMDNRLHTSYDLLKHVLKVNSNKRISENKKNIVSAVDGLVDKGVIRVIHTGEHVVNIDILDIGGGYEKVYRKEYLLFKEPREFYVYMAVKKWSRHKSGAIYSYQQWAEMLNVSRGRAIAIISDLVDKKIVTKGANAYSRNSEVGYESQKICDANNYYVESVGGEFFN